MHGFIVETIMEMVSPVKGKLAPTYGVVTIRK